MYEQTCFAGLAATQAAVVPYRLRRGEVEVLLVTSRGKGRWILPKGKVEAGMPAHLAAGLEAYEEAGVEGAVSARPVGCYRHGRSHEAPFVEVFLMQVERVLDAWPEASCRRRRWMTLAEACAAVPHEGLRALLHRAAALL